MHIQWLYKEWGPAPAWVWVLTAMVLPIANEIVNRAKWTTAQSLLQIAVRALQVPFGRLPMIGEVLDLLSRPPVTLQPAPKRVEPPTAKQDGAPLGPLVLLAVLGTALTLGGCASESSLVRATAQAAVVASAGYRALDTEDAAHESEIATRAKKDDVTGAMQLRDTWRPTYQAVRLALDGASRAIELAWSLQSTSTGSPPPARDARDVVERLTKATAEMVTALASIGVKSPLVTGGVP